MLQAETILSPFPAMKATSYAVWLAHWNPKNMCAKFTVIKVSGSFLWSKYLGHLWQETLISFNLAVGQASACGCKAHLWLYRPRLQLDKQIVSAGLSHLRNFKIAVGQGNTVSRPLSSQELQDCSCTSKMVSGDLRNFCCPKKIFNTTVYLRSLNQFQLLVSHL